MVGREGFGSLGYAPARIRFSEDRSNNDPGRKIPHWNYSYAIALPLVG
jgi:hypothetical protein